MRYALLHSCCLSYRRRCSFHSAHFWSSQHSDVSEKEQILHLGKHSDCSCMRNTSEDVNNKKIIKDPNQNKKQSVPSISACELSQKSRHSLAFKEPILGPTARDKKFILNHRHPKFLLMGLALNSFKETSFPSLLPFSHFLLHTTISQQARWQLKLSHLVN